MLQPTIGLEIHVELKTKTKMFCGCRNLPAGRQDDAAETKPNMNVCPICLAHPGTLPVINRSAVAAVLKLGLALNGQVAEYSYFDRKSYFYPDLPKGYQISQYKKPLVEGGILKNVRICRIHLEEDTGRLLHESFSNDPRMRTNESRIFEKNSRTLEKDLRNTLVDFNRAGVPLMELVTEPDIKSADEAVAFAKELQLILRCLDISDADMEKGQMRVEANISLAEENGLRQSKGLSGRTNSLCEFVLGTKVEVKNLNSFKAVSEAVEYEIKRQTEVLSKGGKIFQETRGWDDKAGATKSQRSKESAHDYRYFPEPDLPPFELKGFDLVLLKKNMPELPSVKRERLAEIYGLGKETAEVLAEDMATADYFEAAAAALNKISSPADYKLLANYFISDLRGLMLKAGAWSFKNLKIKTEQFASFISLIKKGELSSRLAKDLLVKMFKTGINPEILMQESDIKLISGEEELIKVIKDAIKNNPKAVGDYHKGKETALQFLIGQAMAKTRGQAEPEKLKGLFIKELSN